MSQAYDGTYDIFQSNVAITTATTYAVKTAVAGKRLYLTKAILSAVTAEIFTFKSGTTVILGPIYVPAGETVDLGDLLTKCAVGEDLNVTTSTGVAAGVCYAEGHYRG